MVWSYKKLSELAEVSSGGTPQRSRKEFWNGDIPWYSSGELNDFITIAPKEHITESGLTGSNAKIFPRGSLLIGMYDTAALKMSLLDREGTFNQAIAGVKPNENINLSFILYAINSIKPELLKLRRGVRQKNLNQGMIKDILIPDLPLSEQKHIVALLDTLFADLKQARAKTEQNLKNARELFDSYLQQVFSQKGEGWVDKTLKEASLDFGRGKSKHRPRNDASLYDGDYPFVQTGDVRNCEHLITKYSKTYNEAGLAQSKLWPKGTICITIAANIAETGILDFSSCFPDSVIGVVVNPEVTTIPYVEFLLQSFKAILKAKGKGSAQDNINMGTFEKLHFPFPNINKQNEIVNSLNELMISVQQLEVIYQKKLSSIDELKKSILQKTFSGELTATAK
jgi:type I restriction enzyme S subunit